MRFSRVKAKMRRGEAALITCCHFTDPSVYELTSLMGFDGIWLDLEHHSTSDETAANLMRAARVGHQTLLLVLPKANSCGWAASWKPVLRESCILVVNLQTRRENLYAGPSLHHRTTRGRRSEWRCAILLYADGTVSASRQRRDSDYCSAGIRAGRGTG